MIIDNSLVLSDNQAITASASSTNVIDMGAMGTTAYNDQLLQQHLGRGMKVPLLVQVTEDFATLTSLTITLRQSSANNMASPDSLISQTIPVAKLKKGFKLNIDKLPAEITKRYVDLSYTVTGSDATAGKVFASIVSAVEDAYDGNTHS
jgi:hypothetical protein